MAAALLLLTGAGCWRFGAISIAAPAKQTVMVPMRDGVKLATDIYLPEGKGPWPAILSRTPYGKGDNKGQPYVRLGYARVVQDLRGRFASEGDNLAFQFDGWGRARDGYDTVEWIAKQPWCNGKVGTIGGSALGIAQYMMAPSAPPHLLCQQASVGASSLYRHAAYPGGALRKSQVVGWLTGNHWDPLNLKLMQEHSSFDGFWQGIDALSHFDRAKAPCYHIGGWFDTFCQGTVDAYVKLQHEGGEGAKGNQWLLMGPWTHGGSGKTSQGELTFPSNARNPYGQDLKRWFDHWLKGEENGVPGTRPVRYYVMGAVGEAGAPGNEWRSAPDWPVPSTPTVYYLCEGNVLSPQRPREETQLSYDYDPANPVPTRGGRNLVLPKGPRDQREVEGRADVLLFSTPPLEEPVEVTGRVRVRLFASSSARDTDFTAKLCDVYPDGRSMLIADGIIRGRHRETMEKEIPLNPGQVYAFDIDLWSTSIVFNRGHRIRVAISSSNYPRFDANPNTGGPASAEQEPLVAHNTVFLGGEHASGIVLPIVSAGGKGN